MRETTLLTLVWLAWGSLPLAFPQASKPAPKKSTAAASKPTVPKKAAAKSTKKAKRRAVNRPATQRQPTPERYREIQQALIDKGYLQGAGPGTWGPDSVAALRKFQADQKLEETGKLDSLSLIRLGLGPKRDSPAPNGRASGLQPKAEP